MHSKATVVVSDGGGAGGGVGGNGSVNQGGQGAKEKEQGWNLDWNFAAHQGKRGEMEDIHREMSFKDWNLFLICDGHGGRGIVDLVDKTFEKVVFHPIVNDILTNTHIKKKKWETMICQTIVGYDRYLHKKTEHDAKVQASGCTLAAFLCNLKRKIAILINVGDSRVSMLETTTDKKSAKQRFLIRETVDHKPGMPSEIKRIKLAKGFVSKDNRVNGCLALSRALGDFALKKYRDHEYDPVRGAVCAVPDVAIINFAAAKKLDVIVACDGIWDVLTSEDIFSSYYYLTNADDVDLDNSKSIAENIIAHAYSRGSTDNMSAYYLSLFPHSFPMHFICTNVI